MAEVRTPPKGEFAGLEDGRDITRGYLRGLLEPQDEILVQRLAGDWRRYQRTLRDDQVQPLFQSRRLAVTGAETVVEPGAKDRASQAAADFVREQIGALPWDQVSDQMLYGLFYGFAVAECMWARDGARVVLEDLRVRRQVRFRFGWDKRRDYGGLHLITSTRPEGELLPDRKFWVFATGADNADEPYGLGLAHYLYWPVFFKSNNYKFWLTFVERFAAGTPTVRLPAGKADDQAEIDRAKQVLAALQSDSGAVIPDSVVVEILEAARQGTPDYSTLHDRMNAAIAKVIVSQTLTSEAAGGQYKAVVQADIREDVIKADADLLCQSWNRTVGRWLTEWNFPGAKPPQVWRQTEPPEDLNSRAERDSKVYALGFEPTEEYVRETYGEGWVKREKQAPPALPGDEEPPAFAELDPIAAARRVHRNDQAALVAAAREQAGQFREVLGGRVDELLGYLDETGDLVTFRERLVDLLEQGPPPETVDRLQRHGVFARLLGRLRAQQ